MFDVIQPSIGEVFIGIGGMVLFCMVAYWIYTMIQWFKSSYALDIKYNLLQEILIDRVAAKRGIDLQKELEKRAIMKRSKFRKKLELEIYEELFGKDDDEDKPKTKK